MHKTIAEARTLAEGIAKGLDGSSVRIMVAPPFTALKAVADVLQGTNVRLGAQNIASAESGAHTGEISAVMLKDAGVQTVIIGHSERRSIYKEGDELINSKIALAVSHEFEVVFCVGETLAERDSGQAESIVEHQLKRGLDGVSAADMNSIVVAYEPVWAIGTGKTATPADAEAMHAFIRGKIAQWYSKESSESLIIQYGGSVKPDNAAALIGRTHIDGALVGGASLEVSSFVQIVQSAE